MNLKFSPIYHFKLKEREETVLNKWAWCPHAIIDNHDNLVCMYYDCPGFCEAKYCPFLQPIFEGMKK